MKKVGWWTGMTIRPDRGYFYALVVAGILTVLSLAIDPSAVFLFLVPQTRW